MNRSREKESRRKTSRTMTKRIKHGRSSTKLVAERSRKSTIDRCKTVTKKKVCGPTKKSCHYPNVYSRSDLVLRALNDDIVLDEFNPSQIPKLSTPQLCSFLGLASKESIKFNRVVDGRICGPDPEPSNPKVWTKDQLVSYAKTHHILKSSDAQQMSRQDLCTLVADWSYKNRTKDATFNLPQTSINIYPILEYKGKPTYTLPFIYDLLLRYSDMCFFIDPGKSYNAVSYNCDTEEVDINPYLIREMKGCKKRFFVALVRLTESNDDHLGKHSNILLYDKKKNEVWHYEGLRKGLYHECNTWKLFGYLTGLFKKEINPKISFIDAPSYCPNLNFARLIFTQKHKGFNTEDLATGLCIIINLWILDNKFAHPDLNLKQVNEKAIKALSEHEYGMLNHILNWMHDRLENRKVLMNQAKKAKVNFRKYMWDLIYQKQLDRFIPGTF